MPDSNFEVAIARTLPHEGDGYVANDQGRGPSKFGITYKTAKLFDPKVTAEWIRDLTAESAAAWYKQHVWDAAHLALIDDVDVAAKVFDLAVMLWYPKAVGLLQTAAGVGVDHVLGPKTAQAVNAANPEHILAALRAQADQHFREVASAKLVQGKPAAEVAQILTGWLKRLESA